MLRAVPDVHELVEAVYEGATNLHSRLHGPDHWRRVALNGCELIEAGEPANPAVVFAFALLHDSQRLDDGTDPEHGPRAALAVGAIPRRLLDLSQAERALLEDACRLHTRSGPVDDPTLGVCFDADRLDLWRCGIWPRAAFLSTKRAREPERIAACSQREPLEWEALHARFAALVSRAV